MRFNFLFPAALLFLTNLVAQNDTISIRSTVNGHAVIGFNTVERNIFIGDGAGDSLITGRSNLYIGTMAGAVNRTGQFNIGIGDYALENSNHTSALVAIGHRALYRNENGAVNTAIGFCASYNNISGSRNTGLGYLAGWTNEVGNDNLATGFQALYSGEGSSNTAVGSKAMKDNVNGWNNVAVGTAAGEFSGGSGNVFLGYRAGYIETEDNRLYIENSEAGTDDALIYGEFDNDFLRLNAMTTIRNDLLVGGDDKSTTNDTLFFFDVTKGALRAGRISGSNWQQDSIGLHSVALGINVKALGSYSMAVGLNTQALGQGAFAMGDESIADGVLSMAHGYHSQATGNYAVAFGYEAGAHGLSSFTSGFDSEAAGDASAAFGAGTIANGAGSIAVGAYNDPLVNPQNTWNDDTPLLTVGNGDSDGDRSNALVVRKNGLTELLGGIEIGPAGTMLNQVQSGTATIGSNPSGVKEVTIVFPFPFGSIPRVICTVRGGDYVDTFVASTRAVTASVFTVNVFRVDNAGGSWGQNLQLDWIAID